MTLTSAQKAIHRQGVDMNINSGVSKDALTPIEYKIDTKFRSARISLQPVEHLTEVGSV